MSVKAQTIEPKDIIEAYNVHGENFIVIDFEGRKKYPTVDYISIHFKLADNTIINPYLKVKNLKTAGQIQSPEQRQFEVTKLSFLLKDRETNETVEAIEALRLVFESIESLVDKMTDSDMLTSNPKKKKGKDLNGNDIASIVLPSVMLSTPYSTQYKDKKTDEYVVRDNPIVHVNLPFKFGLKKDELEQFGDVCYKTEKGDGAPFMIKTYDNIFYDATTGYYNRQKKPVFKFLGEVDEHGGVKLDNTNIHEYIPKNSIIKGGVIKFECNASKFGLCVKALFSRALYIEKGVYEEISSFDDSELDEICSSSMAKANIKDDDDDMTFDEE